MQARSRARQFQTAQAHAVGCSVDAVGIVLLGNLMMDRKPIVLFACMLAGGFFLFSLGRTLTLAKRHGLEPQAELAPRQVDMGAVAVGQAVRGTFVLRNVGDARLLVTEVKASCQCTIPDLATRVLPPGGSVPIAVEFTAKSAGKKRLQVLVRTNDPGKPVLVVTLLANAVTTGQAAGGTGKAAGVNDR